MEPPCQTCAGRLHPSLSGKPREVCYQDATESVFPDRLRPSFADLCSLFTS